jgi:two-component system response regulator AtoC
MTHGRKVLIVDDEAAIREILTRWLKGWGYGVRGVSSAAEAVALMTTDPADIMLCDVAMPERDGLSLVEQVRVEWPRTAIIMTTGRDDASTVLASRKLGAVAYVVKPFDPVMLHQALDVASASIVQRK